MSQQDTVWIVDDDRSIRWVLEKTLEQEGIQAKLFDNAEALMSLLEHEKPSVIISDIRMPGMDGLTLLTKIQEENPYLPVIIMTAHSDLDSAVASYQGGAFEYLPKPFDVEEAVSLVKRAILHHHKSMPSIEEEVPELDVVEKEIIGEAPAMQEVFRAIGRLANSNITVLINGESGTGKELVAHALHKHSPRSASPFIALNMAAIPHDLIESELFGHEKGAFTGANTLRRGRFEQANGGTLFLDEIGDMPAETQTRLLRVLADGEFYRVGGHIPVKVDVRIIAATHQNLESLVTEGSFREDLFHRLNVIRVHLPKLSERREDIPQLARHFLKRAAEELSVEPKVLTKETEDYLARMDWPGNVRQLENTCRWLIVMASGREVLVQDLPPELLDSTPTENNYASWEDGLKTWVDDALAKGQKAILDEAVPKFERIMIETALTHTAGRRRDASLLLGWGRNTLTRKIKELGIDSAEQDD
ncbi:two-component response regulator NtrC [Marinomonas sp. MED121]|uniref:nitrogen regulation protein NR(I) n=1 Tax=Marinomonas sp. MED121 TaxID=314277 RepID=UPI00006900B6|nr:nitrogen regulation protein NR(I) [Marinomonas sp. MED121]EAQ65752.1 two-component response regulator NtrC [Marinomonas sp. MED121]